MTANALAGDREKALEAGMNDLVAKPINVAELFEVLGRWVQVPEALQLSVREDEHATEAAAEDATSLPNLPGVDTRSGLARVGGKVSVYRKILRHFASRQADAPTRIRGALQGHDLTTAEREAHALKGVAGNIGADRVEAAAKRLEAAIKHGSDTEAPIVELERILGDLVEKLASLTTDPDTPGVAPPKGDAPDLLPELDRLEALLEDSDGEAGDLVSDLQAPMTYTEYAEPMRAIADRIDNFEFDEALELLNPLRAAMRSRGSQSQ
jgi:HPt (histidine-containing phosphotransfer) domain-containing protein